MSNLNEEYLKKSAFGKRKERITKVMNDLTMIAVNETTDLDLNIQIQKTLHLLRNRRDELNTMKP